MATQDDLFARDDIKRIVEKAKSTTQPVLGTNIKLIKDTAQQIEGKEGPNVRPTSSYKNIEKLSQVERDMGYKKRFQVKGIDSPGRVAEIKLLISKKAPNVENFMTQRGVDWEAYNKALKRFRLTVLEPLIKQNPKAMDILTSPAYLDQFAAETRQNMINSPKLRTIYGIEKIFDKKSGEMKWKVPQWAINIENQKLGYVFQSANPRGGLPPGGKVQSKFYQMAQGFWKKFSANMPKEMKALKNINFKLAISEVDKMLTTAKTALQKKQAIVALTALLTSINKGTFGMSLMGLSKASGAYSVLLGAGAISDVLTPTDFLGSKEKDEYVYLPVEEKVEPAPIERFNKGGIMDINHMTRPLGYAAGGPAGMTDLERTGYDRSKSSAWNINDLVRDVVGDIGTSIKSKVSGAGEKIKNLFEGGDDSRYMRFFDKLWKEGYSQKQIDMIWNSGGKINKEDIVPERVEYDFDKEKSFVPEGEFRGAKGGIVSLNHLTRRL